MHGGPCFIRRRAESRFAGALRSFTPTLINASHTVAVSLSCVRACIAMPATIDRVRPPVAVLQPLAVP